MPAGGGLKWRELSCKLSDKCHASIMYNHKIIKRPIDTHVGLKHVPLVLIAERTSVSHLRLSKTLLFRLKQRDKPKLK